jgi:hypothetical protein
MQRKHFKLRWIVLALVGLIYLPSVPSYIMTHSSKVGRVVDTITGKGLSGVAVIAAAEVTSSATFSPETRTATETEYRVIVRTDSDGNYQIPGTWFHLNFSHLIPFFGTTTERWMLTAFKPGYVLTDDEASWNSQKQNDQHQYVTHNSILNNPPSQWKGNNVRVEPIMMNQAQLTIADAARYYGTVARLGSIGTWKGLSGEDILLRKTGNDFFLPRICNLDPQEEIDWADYMNAFVLDDRVFLRKLDQLEPNSLKISGEQGKPAIFRADTVCEAMKAGNIVQ